jgi:AcrR family transcriptional regulator
MKKDKVRTMQKLISAVGAVIRKDGFGALGVNRVATEARVDKVLLYRYFGSMEALLKEYVSASDYYKSASTVIPATMNGATAGDIQQAGSQIILEQLRRLRASTDLQEIYRYELTTDDPVTRSLAEQREREGTAILSRFEERIERSRADLSAIVAVVLAGGIYLILRKKSARVFNGVDLESREGWQRIEKAIDTMLGLVAANHTIPLPKAEKRRAGSHRDSGKRKISVHKSSDSPKKTPGSRKNVE